MAIAALIFDLDGTLVDSETPGLEVLRDMAAARGVHWSHGDMHSRFRGRPMPQCVAQLGRELPVGAEPLDEVAFLARLRQAMAQRFRRDLTEVPGAKALLQQLRIPFAVATNGPREKAELTLGLTGLRELVGQHLYCAPELGSFKPEPGLFLHAAAALGCEPLTCAVVEDSLAGIEGGLAAGMQVFSLHPREGLPVSVADAVSFIDKLSELTDYLRASAGG